MEKFNPIGKKFAFRLDEYSCYKCATGQCSLEDISINELRSLNYSHVIGESDISYCRGMAKLLLAGEFTSPARIYLNSKCSHYEFSDGQHRTCVNSILFKKGHTLILNAEVTTQNTLCRNCLVQKEFNNRMKTLPIIDRIFRTNNYRMLKLEIDKYNKSEFISTL